MKQPAFDTRLLATGQPGEAASIQQPAGLGGFARILSSPLGTAQDWEKGSGREEPELPQHPGGQARGKDASLAAAPGALSTRSLEEEK